jgi:phosphate/phosphite/phosphonate ABC transporter binding protein
MFLEEARLAALINHPNVVQIFDVDQFEGSYYIAMEYIAGPSASILCRQLRKSRTAMPYFIAAEIVAQACDGLHAAHELRDEAGTALALVHRDVSPHNLMITGSGLVKLVDFGIAKAQNTSVQTRTGNIKGKYPYMSPEQCRGDPLDRRTDVFSLGIVFHELVTGQRLFHRVTELMTLKAITEEPIALARDVRADVPEEISNVIARCLRRERDDRHATAAELGEAVRHTVASLGAPSGPATLAEYLKAEFGELLQARADAIRRASELSAASGPAIPVLEGLGSGSHSSRSSAGSSGLEATLPPLTSLDARHSRLRWVVIATVAAILLCAGGGLFLLHLRRPARPTGEPLYFGLPPSFPPAVAQRELADLVVYLERKLDRPIELVVSPSYHELHVGLARGTISFANLPPLQFILARHRDRRIAALVSTLYEGSRTYQALLVVRDDSPLTALPQLRGKRICYVDRGSTSGYLLPRTYLRQQGLDPDRDLSARFSRNHLAVMSDVIAGACDVGAIYSGAMAGAPSLGIPAARLRLLGLVGQMPYDVFSASPALDPRLASRLRGALLELNVKRDLGRAIIGPTFRISGFSEPRLVDFRPIEETARAEGMLK